MEDRDFFDCLYQQWAKTTGADKTFWMPEKSTIYPDEQWNVWAVDEQQNKTLLFTASSEDDVDFVSAVHGCLPDLLRRLHDALDEAERLDEERDVQEKKYAEAVLEIESLYETIRDRDREISDLLVKVPDEAL